MHHDDRFNAGSILVSFLLGGLVGAGLALLLAPSSGTETRRRIREIADEVKVKTEDYLDSTREKIKSTVEKGKEIYEEKKSAITAALEAGKEAFEQEIKSTKNA